MNKKTILKTLVIGLMSLLLISSITPSATSQIKQTNNIKNLFMEDWCDNFDSYTNGQFLDGNGSDGGWKGWGNVPNAGAYVVDDQALSAPHSVEIVGGTDLVHEYVGYTAGKWNYTAWQYIPTDFSGDSYFILLSAYDDTGATNVWTVQLSFNSATYLVESQWNGETTDFGDNLGVWTKIVCTIDLTMDWLEIYYDEVLLASHAWSDTVQGGGGGPLAIAAVDLFANGASAVYYDDICLEEVVSEQGDLDCEGSLTWTDITAGAAVSGEFLVKNIGGASSLLNWEIESYPSDWGTAWAFTPASGTGLAGGDDVTVQVSLNAPQKKKQTFTGIVKIVNSDNPDDFCEIDVSLTTPKAKTSAFIQILLERFPNAFPILRYILNL